LLGRAYLLTGNWFEARNAFTAAKARISDVESRDAATILNEINLALAVIGDPQATEDFSKSLSGGGQTSFTNANSNSKPTSNTP
jgi:hypothetical protein